MVPLRALFETTFRETRKRKPQKELGHSARKTRNKNNQKGDAL